MYKIIIITYNNNGDFFMNKKFVIYNTVLTFLLGFLVHNLYNWIPNPITSIFPVNESLYEHMKLIYLSPIISSIILYFYFKKFKDFKVNNLLFGLITSTIFNIIIFYLLYLPLYNMYGSIMWMTLVIYLISIVLSQYLYFLIIEMNNNTKLNIFSSIMLILIMIILTYFTYNPIKTDFFKDPTNNSYGIR